MTAKPRVKGLTREERKKGVLLPVKRLGWARYKRARVKAPEKIEAGEAFLKRWTLESEEGKHNPVLYGHIAWTSKRQTIEAEVKIRLKGDYISGADLMRKAKLQLAKHAGGLVKMDKQAPGPDSPGLYYIEINEEHLPLGAVKHHYDPGRHEAFGLGKGLKGSELYDW